MLLGDTATAVGGLLSRLQARIAFVSACTHGSVVASFPDPDGTSGGNSHVVNGGRGGGGGRGCRTGAGIAGTEPGRVEEGEGIPSTDGDTAYWRVSLWCPRHIRTFGVSSTVCGADRDVNIDILHPPILAPSGGAKE